MGKYKQCHCSSYSSYQNVKQRSEVLRERVKKVGKNGCKEDYFDKNKGL